MSSRYSSNVVAVVGSRGNFGWIGIEIVGVAGDFHIALVESELTLRPLISNDA